MTAESALASGRRAAEALMTCTCVITRVTGRTLDLTTDLYVPVTTTIFTGKCRIKFASNRVSAREAEGQLRAAQQLQIHLPVDGSEAVAVDDVATITDGNLDAGLTGRAFRVSGRFSQTYATARRLPVESLA